MKLIRKLFSFFWDRSTLIFLIIGGLNTIVSMSGIFVLENVVGWAYFPASATMFALCSIPSFYFNRKYSFQSKAPLGPSILRFSTIVTVCYLLGFAGSQLLMPWFRNAIWPTIPDILYSFIRIVCLQVVFTMLNYVGQRLWAFKE